MRAISLPVLTRAGLRALAALVILALLLACGGEAQAASFRQRISPTCEQPEFMSFLQAYVQAPKEEQMSCIDFSRFIYKGRRIADPQTLIADKASATKLVFSRREVAETGRADQRFFHTLPTGRGENSPEPGAYCYLIRAEGDRRIVTLTSGGQFALESVAFVWDGKHWRVVGVVEESIR
jgi:hypothetical protein